ncbi:MAG: regulatory protein RecX [bacterium]
MFPSKSYTVEQALSKMQRYCSYQERCHAEVRKKLVEMHMIPDAIDHIIVQLIRQDYLNESRFAAIYVQSKFNQKKWGKNRLKQELKIRDISPILIKKELDAISEEMYVNTLNELSAKRLLQITEKNVLKKRKKLADYLLYRGWESHLVYEKVKELIP